MGLLRWLGRTPTGVWAAGAVSFTGAGILTKDPGGAYLAMVGGLFGLPLLYDLIVGKHAAEE